MAFKFASSFVRSLFNPGTAPLPSISFAGDENTGIYSPGADQVGIATAGTARVVVDNAGLITGTGTSLGAWVDYGPSLGGTGWAIGNGVINGQYCQIGKIVHVRALIQFGSTSTYGAVAPTINVPLTSKNVSVAYIYPCRLRDASLAAVYMGAVSLPQNSTTATINKIGTDGVLAAVTNTVPFTWADSDTIQFLFTYEAA